MCWALNPHLNDWQIARVLPNGELPTEQTKHNTACVHLLPSLDSSRVKSFRDGSEFSVPKRNTHEISVPQKVLRLAYESAHEKIRLAPHTSAMESLINSMPVHATLKPSPCSIASARLQKQNSQLNHPRQISNGEDCDEAEIERAHGTLFLKSVGGRLFGNVDQSAVAKYCRADSNAVVVLFTQRERRYFTRSELKQFFGSEVTGYVQLAFDGKGMLTESAGDLQTSKDEFRRCLNECILEVGLPDNIPKEGRLCHARVGGQWMHRRIKSVHTFFLGALLAVLLGCLWHLLGCLWHLCLGYYHCCFTASQVAETKPASMSVPMTTFWNKDNGETQTSLPPPPPPQQQSLVSHNYVVVCDPFKKVGLSLRILRWNKNAHCMLESEERALWSSAKHFVPTLSG